MKSFRHLLYIVFGAIYFYTVYFYFGVDNIVSYSEKVFITQTSLSYISGFVVFFTMFWGLSFIEKFFKWIATRFTENTETDIDDLVLDILFSSIHTVKYLLAFYIAWQFVEAPQSVDEWISEFSSILFLIILLLFVTKLINLLFNQKLIDESKMKAMSRSLMPFVRKTIIAVVWIVGIITIISNLGYDVTALIAGAGVWWIAVALAAQNSITNIFGAITILMNKPFTLWDYVTINGHTGTVKDIGLSYITLIDRLGHNVLIPNANIISSSIENETKRNFRRADFSIGLIYDTTLASMQKWVKIIENILEEYVAKNDLQSYRVNFETFWDFSLNINVTYFSNTKVYNEFVKRERANKSRNQKAVWKKLSLKWPSLLLRW